jgi:hypothetical protein
MDYLDPKKQARNRILLFSGYILVAIAVTIATIVLLNQAYGYGISKNGTVIQNGLVYFSSQPNPAQIYIDGTQNASTTNTRLYLPAGIYQIALKRSGYDDWQRTIELDGGSVEHFDYPFLFPKTLTTNKLLSYATAPTLLTQSPDRRWLLIGKPDSFGTFDIYDLKNPTKAATSITLPDNLLTKSTGAESWQLAEWADDNQHVLLEHDFDGKSEFILVNRTNPAQSVNLNTSLAISPSKATLKNKKFDQYYLFDTNNHTLQTASLSSPAKVIVAQHVLAYKSYGTDTLLYVTDADAPAGKVWLRMAAGAKTYNLHSLAASPSYVVDLTQYSDTMYVAAGASATSKVYIYKDPLGQLAKLPKQPVSPIQVLHVDQPNYLSFSDNAQFIVTENAGQFGVYDIENEKGYSYTAAPPDAPMPHAEWMDGDRLYYVTGGKLTVFDYDQANRHTLVPASSHYLTAFTPNYKYVYTLAPNATGQYELDQTWLLAPADR